MFSTPEITLNCIYDNFLLFCKNSEKLQIFRVEIIFLCTKFTGYSNRSFLLSTQYIFFILSKHNDRLKKYFFFCTQQRSKTLIINYCGRQLAKHFLVLLKINRIPCVEFHYNFYFSYFNISIDQSKLNTIKTNLINYSK